MMEKLRFSKEPKAYTGIDFTNKSGAAQKMKGQYLLGTKIWNAVTNEPGAVVVAYVRNANNRVEQREFFIPGSYFSPVINEWDVPKTTPSEVKIVPDPTPDVTWLPKPSDKLPPPPPIYVDERVNTDSKTKGKPGYPIPADMSGSDSLEKIVTKTLEQLEPTATSVLNQASNAANKQSDGSEYIGWGLIGLFLYRILR